MPDTTNLRKKIIDFKERETLSYRTIASVINENRSAVWQAVTGARTDPKSNLILSKIIQAYGLDAEE